MLPEPFVNWAGQAAYCNDSHVKAEAWIHRLRYDRAHTDANTPVDLNATTNKHSRTNANTDASIH